MGNQLDQLRAARFEGPQALYTTAVKLLSERPAVPDDLAGLVARARYMVGNTSAWEGYDEGASEMIRSLAAAIEALAARDPQWMEIDVRVIEMERIEKAAAESPWVPAEYSMNEVVSDCCDFLRNPRARPEAGARSAWLATCHICGRIVDTREVSEGGDPHGCQYGDKLVCSSDCGCKLLGDPTEAEEVRTEALAAATAAFDAMLFEFQHEPGRCGYEAAGALKMRERLRKRMAADISAALDRIKAEAHAAGMSEAARIAHELGREVDHQDGSYIGHMPVSGAIVGRAILAAIPQAPTAVDGSATTETDSNEVTK